MTTMVRWLLLTMALGGCMGTEPDKPNPKLEPLSANGGDFGQTLIGTTKQIRFKLINDGSGFTKTETLKDINITVPDGGVAYDPDSCPTELEENQWCEIVVYYTPSQVLAMSGKLTVTSNADSAQTQNLSGRGTLALNPALGVVELSGNTSTQFSVAKGQTLTRTYTLFNRGNADDTLTVTGPGANVTDWALTHNCQNPVPPQDSCRLQVTYQPGSAAIASTLTVTVEDAYNKDYGRLVIELSGIPQ